MSTLTDGSILRALGVQLQRDEHNTARPVELVSICAWCDWDKSQSRALRAQGKAVTHGICQMHAQKMLDSARRKEAA